MNDTLRNNNCELGLLSMSSGDFGPAINLIDLVIAEAFPFGPRSLRFLGRRHRLPCDLCAGDGIAVPCSDPLQGSEAASLAAGASYPRAPSLCRLTACLQQQDSSRKSTKADCHRLPCPIFFTSSKVNTQIPCNVRNHLLVKPGSILIPRASYQLNLSSALSLLQSCN